MHAKVVVADDIAFVGSFNFSRSGERNAENVLEIRDAPSRTASRRRRRGARRAIRARPLLDEQIATPRNVARRTTTLTAP